MHIMLFTHYYPPNGGEAADRAVRLANYLVQHGHQVTVLTTVPHYPSGNISPQYKKRWSYDSNEEGVHIVRVWVWSSTNTRISRKLLNQWSFMLMSLFFGLRLPRPNVIFIESQPFFTGIAGRILAWVKRAPFVQNVSDLWPDHLLSVGILTESHPVYHAARWIMDRGFKHASALTSMSPAWSRKLVEYTEGQVVKITTILRGADLERFRPKLDTAAFRARHNLGDKTIVSFIGTFALQYDFTLQLNVARRLAHRQDVLFVFIGTGSQRDAVEELASQVPNVRLIAWVDHAEIPFAWNVSTMNFWALRPEPLYEGTIPAKLFEAFACGVPVVAAQKGEAADIIKASQGGLVVDTGDEDGLLNAIESLLNDPNYRGSLAQHARTYAEKHFDIQDALRHYEMVIVGAKR